LGPSARSQVRQPDGVAVDESDASQYPHHDYSSWLEESPGATREVNLILPLIAQPALGARADLAQDVLLTDRATLWVSEVSTTYASHSPSMTLGSMTNPDS